MDGQFETINKSLENCLRCFVGDHPKDWVQWVSLAEWWYNTLVNTLTKMTPFQAMYGFQPP